MPTYEYGCDACGNTWEAEQRITADPLKQCPACNKESARRLISGGNFILKGGGWYADGYGNKKSAGEKPKEGGSDAKSESSAKGDSSAKSESTPKSESSKASGSDSSSKPSDTKSS